MQVATASVELLTGDDWAARYKRELDAATRTILLSVYMISHHWLPGAEHGLDLVADLCNAARRGVVCKGIVDQPNVQGRREPFNRQAAKTMGAAGWAMRCIPDRITLHEKVTVIDGNIVFIGSHNISMASACTNIDTSLLVTSEEVAQAAAAHFWKVWFQSTPGF